MSISWSATQKIRCLLVDDHILFRQGIRRLLETEGDIEVVGESSDATDALLKVRDLHPNVLLMDLGMPGLSPVEAVRHIRRDHPEIRIVLLTMYDDEEYLMRGLEAGAAGYVLKDAACAQLLTAVRDVSSGGKYMSPRMLGRLVDGFRGRGREVIGAPTVSALTLRERETLKLLAEGHTVKSISILLSISVKTVASHKHNLMRKLDIHNKAQLVTYAFQNSIVRLPV